MAQTKPFDMKHCDLVDYGGELSKHQRLKNVLEIQTNINLNYSYYSF